MLAYQNADHSALLWYQAVKAVMEGKCAFTSMGDWAYGEFAKAKMKDNEDFGWVSHPGTDGGFIIIADGFTLAKGAPHRQEAITWLKVCGSRDAQEAFNLLKGSIPSRTDIDKSKFGPYHNWSMNSFAKDKLLPSCVHGAAAPPDSGRPLTMPSLRLSLIRTQTDSLRRWHRQLRKPKWPNESLSASPEGKSPPAWLERAP